MGNALQLALSRLFRSRWGVALLLAALVLAVLGISRLAGGNDAATTGATPSSAAASNPGVDPDPSDDDSTVTEDGGPVPTPTTKPGTAAPEAVAYAFASAWVDHKNVSAKTWYSGLLPNITKGLAAKLDGVDPADVPADQVLDRPKMGIIGQNTMSADIKVDTGTITLQLTAPGGHWLVDAVDWNPS